MAKVLFGPTIAGIRGKLAGAVFSANGSGAYLKHYAPPVSRLTPKQLPFRSRTSEAGTQWQAMSDAERAAWVAYAAAPNEPDYDPWGNQRYLSGYYWFIRANNRRYYSNGDWNQVAPSGAAQTPITGLDSYFRPLAEGASTISWSAPTFAASDVLIVEAAISDNPTRLSPKSPFLIILAMEDPEPSPADCSLGFWIQFGDPIPGQAVFLRAYNQSQYGNRSTVATASSIIQAS